MNSGAIISVSFFKSSVEKSRAWLKRHNIKPISYYRENNKISYCINYPNGFKSHVVKKISPIIHIVIGIN